MMVLHSSLRSGSTQSTTLWGLEICLKSRVGNSRVTEIKIKENVARRTSVIALADDKPNSVALLNLTQLQNISSTSTITTKVSYDFT